jgi:hypothetical protein
VPLAHTRPHHAQLEEHGKALRDDAGFELQLCVLEQKVKRNRHCSQLKSPDVVYDHMLRLCKSGGKGSFRAFSGLFRALLGLFFGYLETFGTFQGSSRALSGLF